MKRDTWQLNALMMALLVTFGTSAQSATTIAASGTTTTASDGMSTAASGTTTAPGAPTAVPGSDASSGTPTTPPLSAGQTRVADRVAAPFAVLAGSKDNAVALATGLRTGTDVTLTTTSTDASGATVVTTESFTPPTKPMGWGNVSHALALAQFALSDAGITNPTTADLQVALLGGQVTTADGTSVSLAGVLKQRADGMGWGQIARSYGTTMGAVNHSLHASVSAASTTTSTTSSATTKATTPAAVPSAGPGKTGVVSAAGARLDASDTTRGFKTAAGTAVGSSGAKGLTTAGGTSGTKGLTTAAGGSAGSHGVVTAAGTHGNGNALGRGIVTASGTSAGASNGAIHRSASAGGVVTAAGANGGGVVTARGQDAANGNGHGKGRDGGG